MRIPKEIRWIPGHTLGEGGQAQVIEVTDREGTLPGIYALKAIPGNKPQKAYERFMREIESLKKLNHESIIKIVDYSADRNFAYYVMERIDGAQSLLQG